MTLSKYTLKELEAEVARRQANRDCLQTIKIVKEALTELVNRGILKSFQITPPEDKGYQKRATCEVWFV